MSEPIGPDRLSPLEAALVRLLRAAREAEQRERAEPAARTSSATPSVDPPSVDPPSVDPVTDPVIIGLIASQLSTSALSLLPAWMVSDPRCLEKLRRGAAHRVAALMKRTDGGLS